jgi:hypothetical protein
VLPSRIGGQRRKPSGGGHEAWRLQPEHGAAVNCSALVWLADIFIDQL